MRGLGGVGLFPVCLSLFSRNSFVHDMRRRFLELYPEVRCAILMPTPQRHP
jgi:hypothetical protein